MKSVIKLLSSLFVILVLTNTANAESPREQLKQMVEQLQKSSNDIALREKIIKLAQQLKPAPALPDEAERRMQRGAAALEGAKSVAGYRDAAKEFEQATLAAPWYGDAYFNLGVAQDKAENYEAALRSLKLALMASPDDKEIKALIFKVEYRNEKAHSPEVEAAQQTALKHEQEEALIKSLDGGVWLCSEDQYGRMVIEVKGRTAAYVHYAKSGNVYRHFELLLTGPATQMPEAQICREGQHSGLSQKSWWCPGEFVISSDGSKISRSIVKSPSDSYYVNGTETCRRTR